MNDIQRKHQEAMEFAQRAALAQRRGSTREFVELSRRAFELERDAALKVAQLQDFEPSRSVLVRSAASLALDCGDIREAERMIAIGLAGDPPEELAEELRDLLEDVHLARHLRIEGVQIASEEIQLSLAGSAVGAGFIAKDEFDNRVNTIQKLAERTNDRRKGKPFQILRGYKQERIEWDPWLSVPRVASFAVTIRFGNPKAQRVMRWDQNVEQTLDDLLENLDLLNKCGSDELENRIPNLDYRTNFLALAKRLAPDGEKVSLVGLTVMRKAKPWTVAIRRPRRDVSIAARPKPKAVVQEFRGVLRQADATGKIHHCTVVPESGHPIHFSVPDGLIDDIVRPMWGRRVVVRAEVQGKRNRLVEVSEDS